MRRKILNLFYLVVLAINLVAIYLDNEILRNATKPLLMPVLVFCFIDFTRLYSSSLKKWIIAALLFSWAGDVLLLFESDNSNYFIFGLVAFLMAHIFYILFYENLIRREKIKRKHQLSLIILIYYLFLIYLLTPHLAEMKWPVWIYGLVISFMMVQALQTKDIENKRAATQMIAGAVLFIVSDSLLAINKFYMPFDFAGIAIMLTYGLAQLMITHGAGQYITSASKQ
jgi:uncharacterized membrane protein YhhN